VAAVSFLLIVLSIFLSGSPERAEIPTTYSVGSAGAKAAFLLLQKSGYDVRRWEQSLDDLTAVQNATLILAEPEGAARSEERSALTRFMERGGRVIATGLSGVTFLAGRHATPDPIRGMTWLPIPARAPSSITRAAPVVTMARAAYWDGSLALPLYGDGENLRVVKYVVGEGDAIWWASATPLSNAGIRQPGNLEFFLACLGDNRRPVLWDEWFHGRRPAAQPMQARSTFAWIGLQLAGVTIAVLLTYSRRSGPILTTTPDTRLSPLEFVKTLGLLYQRANAAPIAVDIAYQRLRYRLARRLGVSRATPVEDLERAVRDRWQIRGTAFGDLLRACESASLGTGGGSRNITAAEALKLSQELTEWTTRLGLAEAPAMESVQ
jgi:hypothetical protein